MTIFLIALCSATLTVQQVFKKQFSLRCAGGNYIFSALVALCALPIFLPFIRKEGVGTEILPYSAGFAVAYAMATVCSVTALKTGSLAITSLILSYSMILPTFYGFLFLNEKITILKCGGIFLLLLSLFLVRSPSSDGGNEGKTRKPPVTWLISVVIAFVANGLCSVIQTAQLRRFQGMQNGCFMVFGLGFSAVFLLVPSLLSERKVIPSALKKGALWAAACGVCNGVTNYLVMAIVSVVASSVFFPVLPAGQLVFTFVLSVALYREKFIPRQIVGLVFGVASVVLLNL